MGKCIGRGVSRPACYTFDVVLMGVCFASTCKNAKWGKKTKGQIEGGGGPKSPFETQGEASYFCVRNDFKLLKSVTNGPGA